MAATEAFEIKTDPVGVDVVTTSDFVVPQREILKCFDVNKWFYSKAYADYMKLLHELNDSVRGFKTVDDVPIRPELMDIIYLLEPLKKWIEEYPPEDMGNQRYGNKAYRHWHARLTKESKKHLESSTVFLCTAMTRIFLPTVQDADSLLRDILPDDKKSASIELVPYLLDSFGNATRIDYGSGHEASFMVFILCLYRLGVLTPADNRVVVLRLFNKYLRVVRELQSKYRMEPAGSRGVHAIDDFQFLPFLFGSAQLIGNRSKLVPDSYLIRESVLEFQHFSLFFDAVAYIYETKTGPFSEHSNQLWNISAVQTWDKVNSGMFKMYEAEVLKKFPVVQHFLFGSLFPIEKRADAPIESLKRVIE